MTRYRGYKRFSNGHFKNSYCVKSFQIRSIYWFVFSRIQSKCEKYGPEKTPYLDTFHAVSVKGNLTNTSKLDYNSFKETNLNLLSSQSPFEKIMFRANERIFMNKEIHKSVMRRSKLRK